MERLTRRINGVVVYVGAKNPYSTGQIPCEVEPAGVREMMDRLAAYEDRGCAPEEVLPKDKADEIALKLMRLADLESICSYTRLRELAEADKDGRLVVLPCNVGDTIYHISKVRTTHFEDDKIIIDDEGRLKIYEMPFALIHLPYIGKTVFLTREEAENALEAIMVNEFYSNCFIEMVKAKLRNPAVKVMYLPAFLNECYCPHWMWLDKDGEHDFHFKCRLPWWKWIWHRGYIRTVHRGCYKGCIDHMIEKKYYS